MKHQSEDVMQVIGQVSLKFSSEMQTEGMSEGAVNMVTAR